MTDEQPEPWADMLWILACATENPALTIQRAFVEREAELVGALEGMLAEWDKFTRYGSPMAKASNENVNRATAALKSREAGHG